jgi:hypothetical protein
MLNTISALYRMCLMGTVIGFDRMLPKELKISANFPSTIDELKISWPWIQKQLLIPSDAIITYREIASMSQHGVYMSSWALIVVKYKDSSGKQHEIRARCKFVPEFSSFRQALQYCTSQMHMAEAFFYQKIANQISCRVPKCYGAFVSPFLLRMCIIQEDLAGSHFEEFDEDVNALENARLTMVSAAKLHGKLLRSTYPTKSERDQFLPILAYLPLSLLDLRKHQKTNYIPRGRASYVDGPLVPVFKYLLEHSLQTPLSYIHGDMRKGNVIIVDNQGEKEACIIDWATSRWGQPAFDIAYYITLSIRKEHRAYEKELLELYHNSLILYCSNKIEYRFSDFYDDYLCSCLLSALVISLPGMQGDVVLNEENYKKCLTAGIMWGEHLIEVARLFDFARLAEVLNKQNLNVNTEIVTDLWLDAATRIRDGSASLLAEWDAKTLKS